MARRPFADRSGVSARRLRRARPARAQASVGRCRAVRRTRRLRFLELGSRACRQPSRRGERVGHRGSRRQRLGVDEHGVRAVRRLPCDGIVSGILRRLFRRRALRDEGRVAGDGARADSSVVPQLVSRALSVCLRDVPLREGDPMSVRSGASRAHPPADFVKDFASDVQYYLTLQPRQLPSRYFYDDLGSALFEAICRLPWYGITRTELRMLETHGRCVFERLKDVSTIVELGSGDGGKLRALVQSGTPHARALTIHLVDVSASALTTSARTLSELDELDIVLHEATYETGLDELAEQPRRPGRMLAVFLGSNIGNFDAPGAYEFLRSIRRALRPGDGLLLGADLVKPEAALQIAYDDPLGVTAAFNRNLLVRINGELGGDFDVDAFSHRAVWNEAESRVEMHLVATRQQRVRIPAADLAITFEAGGGIWTESAYKYDPDEVTAMLESAGFRRAMQWVEPVDRFALTLGEAV